MELSSKQKSYSFKVENKSRNRSRNKSIEKQSTLIGSYMHLMMHQKLVVSLIRISGLSEKEKIIPVCFKLDRDQIPKNFKQLKIHPENLVKIIIAGLDPIPSVLVIVAEDSQELYSAYKILFDKNNKSERLPDLPQQIKNWFFFEGIKIEQFSSETLTSISSETLEKISKFVTMKKQKEKIQKASLEANVAAKNTISRGESSRCVQEKVQTPVFVKSTDKLEILEKDKSLTAPNNEKNINFKSLYEKADNLAYESVKNFALETVKAIEIIAKSMQWKNQGEIIPTDYSMVKGDEFKQIRIIPEEDKTYEKNNVTYIEGILPVNSSDYRQAMKLKAIKQSDELEPSMILNNLIKHTFPRHWIVDVTLKGAGGRQSLLTIWNYRNPLTDPCEGSFENRLGESRLRAIIDHAVRKSHKHSYDKIVEKNIISAFSKAMHSKRSKFHSKGSQKDSFWDPENSDEDVEYVSDDDSNVISQIKTRSQKKIESSPAASREIKFPQSIFEFEGLNEMDKEKDDFNYLDNDDDSIHDLLSSPKVLLDVVDTELQFSEVNLQKNSSTPRSDKLQEKEKIAENEDSGITDSIGVVSSQSTPLKRLFVKDSQAVEVKKRKFSGEYRSPLTQSVQSVSTDEATYDSMLNDDLSIEPIVTDEYSEKKIKERDTNLASKIKTMQFQAIQESTQVSEIHEKDIDAGKNVSEDSSAEELSEQEKALWDKIQQRMKKKKESSISTKKTQQE